MIDYFSGVHTEYFCKGGGGILVFVGWRRGEESQGSTLLNETPSLKCNLVVEIIGGVEFWGDILNPSPHSF